MIRVRPESQHRAAHRLTGRVSVKNKDMTDLLDAFELNTATFMSRVEKIQERLNIDPENDAHARQGLHDYLLYKEIMRLEDMVEEVACDV
jgi:hypothetical protein